MSTATAVSRYHKLELSLPRLDAVGLVTGVIYIIFFAAGFRSLTDPDYWWHLRTGQLIVQSHRIPYHDVFSFTIVGHRWLVDQWLAEVLIYLSVNHFGYAVTLGIFTVLSLVSLGLMHRLLISLRVPRFTALLLVFLAMTISYPYWVVRPQVLSWFFLAICVNALMRRTDPPWALIPCMALWANMHAGFIFGLLVITAWFVARCWDHLADGAVFEMPRGALFVAACWGATMLNPNGPLLVLHRIPYLPFFGGSADLQTVTEWASPNFHSPIHYPLAAGIVLLVGLGLPGRVRDRFAVMLSVAFTLLALDSARYQPLFAICFLPAIGIAARDLPTFRFRPPSALQSTAHWFIVSFVVVPVTFAVVAMLPNSQMHEQAISDGLMFYPTDAAVWVRQHRPAANVFAEYSWGGYLINSLYPEGHVFIDGRSDTYGPAVVSEFRSILSADFGWQQRLESSGADVALIRPTSPLATALSETDDWTLTYSSPQAVVFVHEAHTSAAP